MARLRNFAMLPVLVLLLTFVVLPASHAKPVEGTEEMAQIAESKIGEVRLEGVKPCKCLQRKEAGLCYAIFHRYFYNKETGKCEEFQYGGCAGNENNFQTLEECQGSCEAPNEMDQQDCALFERKGREIALENDCLLPMERGICKAAVSMYYFNSKSGECEEFTWGGCGGNANKFEAVEECNSKCNGAGGAKSARRDTRDLAVRKVACSSAAAAEAEETDSSCTGSATERWTFDWQSERCRSFESKCEAVEGTNNYASEAQCLEECKDMNEGVGEAMSDETAEQAALGIAKSCENIKCPGGDRHYLELGCTPVFDLGACCPTRYNCPESPGKNETQCAYKGKMYNVGEPVKAADSDSDCRASCTCTMDGIDCASIECPEALGYFPRGENCTIGLYKGGECCAYDYACGNETRSCEFEGKSYIEGEQMYPKDKPCTVCVCKAGFNGTLSEEFCEEKDCGIQVWYSKQLERGCSPVYLNNTEGGSWHLSCCPIMWKCPDDEVENTNGLTESAENIDRVAASSSTTAEPQTSAASSSEGSASQQPSVVTSEAPAVDASSVQTSSETPMTTAAPKPEDPCEMPVLRGHCRAAISAYFFNKTSEKCEEFLYSGCGGNGNNFEALTDCKQTCVKPRTSVQSRFSLFPKREKKTDPCTMPMKTGDCKAFFPRFFFNPETNSCQLFIFGGCGRNENNFFSFKACSASCMATKARVCDQVPKDLSEKCDKEAALKYYYDTDDATCVQFNSTGCSTNNVFDTRGDCMKTCTGDSGEIKRISFASLAIAPTPKASTNSPCVLPKRTGPCYGFMPSYYFDGESKTCKQFVYGGCMGNANRFGSLDACKTSCERAGENSRPFVFSGSSRPQTRTVVTTTVVSGGSSSSSEEVKGNDETTSTTEAPMIFARAGRVGSEGKPQVEDVNVITAQLAQEQDGMDGNVVEKSEESDKAGAMVQKPQEEDQSSTVVPVITTLDSKVPDSCSLPVDVGTCSQDVLRFHWDGDTCKPFNFTGCGGNKNNYRNEHDCRLECDNAYTELRRNSDCVFGNQVVPFGQTLSKFQCNKEFCTCVTPPSLTCTYTSCESS